MTQNNSQIDASQLAVTPTVFPLAGDLSGLTTRSVVSGLKGIPIANTPPTDGYPLAYNYLINEWQSTTLRPPNLVPVVVLSAGQTYTVQPDDIAVIFGSDASYTAIILPSPAQIGRIIYTSLALISNGSTYKLKNLNINVYNNNGVIYYWYQPYTSGLPSTIGYPTNSHAFIGIGTFVCIDGTNWAALDQSNDGNAG